MRCTNCSKQENRLKLLLFVNTVRPSTLNSIQYLTETSVFSSVVCSSTMKVCTFTVLVCIVIVLVTVDARPRGGRGGGRSGGSKSKSGSKSGSSGSSGKSRITKYTPIKATTVRSPVIVSQTKLGSRSSTFTKVVAGYLVYRYVLSNAPVYREGYPMYRSYVVIPEDRAVRLSFEEQKLLDAQGNLCLAESSTSQTLREEIDENLVDLKTTVKYKSTGRTVELHGVDNTVSLEDIKDQDFEVTTTARYNTTIVEGTTCTQLIKKVEGTMVQLYETNPDETNPNETNPDETNPDETNPDETNPDSACAVFINFKLLIASIALLGFLHC